MARYIDHIVIPSDIIKRLTGAVENKSFERYNLQVNGIHGSHVHLELNVVVSSGELTTLIRMYNSMNMEICYVEDKCLLGSHRMKNILSGDKNARRVVLEDQTEELLSTLNNEEGSEQFLDLEYTNVKKRMGNDVVISYYTFVPNKFNSLVSISSEDFSYSKHKVR